MAIKVFQIREEYTAGAQPCVMNFHASGTDGTFGFTPGTAQGLADIWAAHTALHAQVAAMLNTTDHVTGVTVRELLTPGSTAVPDVGFTAIGTAGTRSLASGALPLPLCGMLQLKTSGAVRGGQSWVHLPPIRDTGQVDPGGSIATVGFYQTAITALIAEINHWKVGGSKWSSSDWGLCAYARTRRAAGLPQFAFPVTAVLQSPTTHYLRSRKTAQAV